MERSPSSPARGGASAKPWLFPWRKLGCRVVLAARTSGELEKVKLDIQNDKGVAIAVPTDLTRDEDIDMLVRESERQFGAVDFLINNAGWGKRASVVRAKIEDWDQTLRVNLRAPMLLAQNLLPAMIEKGEGAVINIGSVSGKSGEANGAAYSASKFGLIGFTQSLYEEVREHGVKVVGDPAGLRRYTADPAEPSIGSEQDDSSR